MIKNIFIGFTVNTSEKSENYLLKEENKNLKLKLHQVQKGLNIDKFFV